MAKLTDEAKEYIQKNLHLSDRQLARDMLSEFQIKITHKPIGNYRKKLKVLKEAQKEASKRKKEIRKSRIEVPKSKPKPRKLKVDVTPSKVDIRELLPDVDERIKKVMGIIPDPSKPILTEEEVTEVFDFFEHISRKRQSNKFDRKKILNIFLRLNGVKIDEKIRT